MPESAVLEILEKDPSASEEDLARQLATKAQELSLDKSVDSPFALLAKDNDILWGGGRPDDITVIVTRIVDTTREQPPEGFKPFTGPGAVPDQVLAARPRGGPVAAAGAAKEKAFEELALKEELPEW